MHHIPVLHSEVLSLLDPKEGESVLDVTLGLGGHAKAFLECIGEKGHLIAFEIDEENLNLARENLSLFKKQVEFHHLNFSEIGEVKVNKVDILFADLGLSSPHVDDPRRGFTFREDALLDMRFDRSQGVTATELIQAAPEKEIARILHSYGELKTARKLARIIKESEPIRTTFELKQCVERAVGYRAKHVLPQVFQALRIAVNDELGALEVLLREGPYLLKRGGRTGVISYHSLEDRMVKQAFRSLSAPVKNPVTGAVTKEPEFEILTKKPIVPSEEEIRKNPRARSAKLRAIRLVNV